MEFSSLVVFWASQIFPGPTVLICASVHAYVCVQRPEEGIMCAVTLQLPVFEAQSLREPGLSICTFAERQKAPVVFCLQGKVQGLWAHWGSNSGPHAHEASTIKH